MVKEKPFAEKELRQKTVEILRYCECLEKIDDDVADLVLKSIRGNDKVSINDLTIGMQKVKDKIKKELIKKIKIKIKEVKNGTVFKKV